MKPINFSNKKIFDLVVEKRRKIGYGPWETEIYSMGKILRKKYFYPSFLPIFVGSDHGVNWGSKLRPNEKKNKFIYFLTYNLNKKNKINNSKLKFKAVNITHPWIFFRKFFFKNRKKKNKKGTIVFFPHSIPGGKVNFNMNLYLKNLKRLEKKFYPITICLYYNDTNMKLIKKLRKNNFGIVTFGHPLNFNFVDNFYSISSNFKYATSPLINSIGSNVYLCHEAGLKFFFYGGKAEKKLKNFKRKNSFHLDLNFYSYKNERHLFYKFKRLFHIKNLYNKKAKNEKDSIVNHILSKNLVENRFIISLLFYFSFIRHINIYIKHHLFYNIKKNITRLFA